MIDHGQAQTDYSNFLGGKNILPVGGETEEQDPFCGEIPDDHKGYSMYKQFYENRIEEIMHGTSFFSLHPMCEGVDERGNWMLLKEHKEGHAGSGVIMACNHVLRQDPYNPEGVRFWPMSRASVGGYYLCSTCSKLLERKRFHLGRDLAMKCANCVLQSITKIGETHPDRLINLIDV